MKDFSFRAVRVMEDTLSAAQQADELGGVETLEEYARMMLSLSDEFNRRAKVAINRMLEGEV